MSLTVKQVSERCGVSRQYVEQLIRENKLKATKHGKMWLITEGNLKKSKLWSKLNLYYDPSN
jgi:excisionase family DNA binding protein